MQGQREETDTFDEPVCLLHFIFVQFTIIHLNMHPSSEIRTQNLVSDNISL